MTSSPPTGRSLLIGPYRVLASLGSGGMAEVLKVQDTRTGESRALKLHHVPTQDEEVYLSYRRELRALSRCAHPHLRPVLEYGVHEQRPYLVMEFVEGVGLGEYLASRGLPPGPDRDQLATRLAMQIASALEHIHSQQIVHLDLKPANILVTPSELVKIIDFGIAQDLETDARGGGSDVVGTYAYCSPEQISGRPCDHRSDLYSFGVVLYQLVTGSLPFVADQAVAFILKHVHQPPDPPESYYPDIPPALRDLILHLLEKNPAQRPQSARAVEQTLRLFHEEQLHELPDECIEVPHALRSDGRQLDRTLYEPAFVGREAELSTLEGAFTLLQAGAGGLVVLLGESGIGKSRLIDEGLASARLMGLQVYAAACLPIAGQPYQGLLELVEGIVRRLAGKGPGLIQVLLKAQLPVLARAFPAMAALLPEDCPPVPDADPLLELERLQVALRAFLEVALPGPTVLVLKDLHLADPGTLAMLAWLSRTPPGVSGNPILWLTSASTDALTENHPVQAWLEARPAYIQRLPVGPLDSLEVEALVRSMLGGREMPEALSGDLLKEARGNPLFTSELVKSLMDRGDLQAWQLAESEKTQWLLLPSDGPEAAPAEHGLEEMLADRLAMLPPPALDLLEKVAVLGRPCGIEWLEAVSGLPEDPLLDALDELLKRRILVESRWRGHSIFALQHARMGDVVRARMGEVRRLSRHRDAAAAWRAVHGETDPTSLEVLASQLFQGQAWEVAAPYLLRAAEARLRLGLYQAARALLEQALTCFVQKAPDDPRVVLTARLGLGRVHMHLGQLEEAMAQLKQATLEAAKVGALDYQGQASFLLARLSSQQGDYLAACKHYAGAIKVQRNAPDLGPLVRSLNGMAGGLWFLGDYAHARQLFEEAATGARRLRDDGLLAQSSNGLGLVAVHEGRFSEAASHFVEAANLSRQGGRDLYFLVCQLNEAEVERSRGELARARGLIGEVLDRLEQVGDQEGGANAFLARAAVALELHDLPLVERLVTTARERLQRLPQHFARATRHLILGQLELARGNPVGAQAELGDALRLAEAYQYRELTLRAQRLQALALIRGGAVREGLLRLHKALTETDRIQNLPGSAEGRLFYAEGLVAQGAKEEARGLLEQTLRPLRQMGMRLHLLQGLILLGRLGQELGQGPQAARALEEAMSHLHVVRQGLVREERATFDTRPELSLLGALLRQQQAAARYTPRGGE